MLQQDALFHNPLGSNTTITVIDPKHPLFQRSFSVLSISRQYSNQQLVYVIYREGITLRIPATATDINGKFCTPLNKFTTSSIEELVTLAQECNILSQSNQKMSGINCSQKSNKKYSTN